MSIYKGLLVLFGYFLLGTGGSPFAHESFQRLESGENESNSNEEVVNVCCQRESYFETIGIGKKFRAYHGKVEISGVL